MKKVLKNNNKTKLNNKIFVDKGLNFTCLLSIKDE